MSSGSCKERIHIETEYDTFDLEGYTCELSANSFIPPIRKNQTKQRSVFNCHQQKQSLSIYDKIFQVKSDFNPKIHRDDRQHSKSIGLNQGKEEEEKSCPSRSSSEYGRGHSQNHRFNDRSYKKVEHIKNDFYRNNGVI